MVGYLFCEMELLTDLEVLEVETSYFPVSSQFVAIKIPSPNFLTPLSVVT